MKILIVGGHVTPAIAVIDELLANRAKQPSIDFVGRKYATDREKTLSYEYKIVTKRKIPFYPLYTGRMTRLLTPSTLSSLVKIPGGLIHSYFLLKRIRPDLILTFGGYLALPVALIGYLLKIPLFTHEQTMKPGLANRIISIFCKKILIAFPEAQNYFPHQKTILCGNPVRSAVFQNNSHLRLPQNRPVLYITGGSLGSHSINRLIRQIIGKLIKKYTVIHQTGSVKEYGDFKELNKFRQHLLPKDQRYYIIKQQINEKEIGQIYSMADLVIGRSGANTFSELLALKKVALFIPLPWSANHEQQIHAQYFVKNKIGAAFDQSQSSGQLLQLIDRMIAQLKSYGDNYKYLSLQDNRHAAKKILEAMGF